MAREQDDSAFLRDQSFNDFAPVNLYQAFNFLAGKSRDILRCEKVAEQRGKMRTPKRAAFARGLVGECDCEIAQRDPAIFADEEVAQKPNESSGANDDAKRQQPDDEAECAIKQIDDVVHHGVFQ